MIQVGNTGLYFDGGNKGHFQIYFDCRTGRLPRLFHDYQHSEFIRIVGDNVDCTGEIFKILLDWMPYIGDNKRFLKNHEFLIKKCIKEQFKSQKRMVECFCCGTKIEQDKNGDEMLCPPTGTPPDWHEDRVSSIPDCDKFVTSEDAPITFLKDFDLRSEYIYSLHMICRIKSIKNPLVVDGRYEQQCVLCDNNTSKTLKATLNNDVADYDKWNKGDLVETKGIYKNGRYYIVYMRFIEEKEPEVIITNRNDETPGYNDWRKSIINRDSKCVCCGLDKHLEAHHLFGYKENPELATNVHNGVTLCKFCHDKYHSVYGLKDINPVDFMNFIKRFGVKE